MHRLPCPFLPDAQPSLDYRYLRELGSARGTGFYLRALVYGQTLWLRGYSARALLAVTRGLYADLRGKDEVLQQWPLPYRAVAWIVAHHPANGFLGNPRVSYQHQADRVRGVRAQQKSARAWACWLLVREVRPDLPGDPRHRIVEPSRDEVAARLDRFGLPGETSVWNAAHVFARQLPGK